MQKVTDAGQLNPGVIPKGTYVSSHYIHYEPDVYSTAQGSAAFDAQILGVEVLQASLDATNFLGDPATTYPTAAQCVMAGIACGLELPPDMIQVNNFWVRVFLDAFIPGDRVRVITRCGD